MTMHRILNDDWSEYNYRKKTAGADPTYFISNEKWEIEYLVNKIAKTHPQYSHSEIRKAVTSCSKILVSPCPRTTFIQCVMGGLGNS